MRKPAKPKRPNIPRKPKEFHNKLEQVGYYNRTSPITLSEFVKRIKTAFAKKKKLDLESIKLSDIALFEMYSRWGWISKEPNTAFPKQNEHYLKCVAVYEQKLSEYEERLKKYEIDLELYNAWLVKKREDKLKDKLKKLEKQLEAVKREKRELLETIEDENEKARTANKA